MSTDPKQVETALATTLAAHQTSRTVMGGWTTRNGKDNDRRYGWRCGCGADSPDRFKVDLTASEADAGRFGHVAEVIIAAGWVSPAEHRAEVERLTKSVGAFSAARDAAKRGWQVAKDKVARVEALAEGPTRTDGGYQPYAVELRGGIHLAVLLDDLRAALGDPERDQEGPALPLSVLCNSCGRALANVGEWCCNRYTRAADVTTIGGPS